MTLEGRKRGEIENETRYWQEDRFGKSTFLDKPYRARNVDILIGTSLSGLILAATVYVLAGALIHDIAPNEFTLTNFAVAFACGLALPTALRLLTGWNLGASRGSKLQRYPSSSLPELAIQDKERAERQLLEAIEHYGEITPAIAAIKTPLSVEEADRLLSGLANRGYLEVRVEEGKLVYGL